jgi:hypothetical protein
MTCLAECLDGLIERLNEPFGNGFPHSGNENAHRKGLKNARLRFGLTRYGPIA